MELMVLGIWIQFSRKRHTIGKNWQPPYVTLAKTIRLNPVLHFVYPQISSKQRIMSLLHHFSLNDLGTKVCLRIFLASSFCWLIRYQNLTRFSLEITHPFLVLVPFALLNLCNVESYFNNPMSFLFCTAILTLTHSFFCLLRIPSVPLHISLYVNALVNAAANTSYSGFG